MLHITIIIFKNKLQIMRIIHIYIIYNMTCIQEHLLLQILGELFIRCECYEFKKSHKPLFTYITF